MQIKKGIKKSAPESQGTHYWLYPPPEPIRIGLTTTIVGGGYFFAVTEESKQAYRMPIKGLGLKVMTISPGEIKSMIDALVRFKHNIKKLDKDMEKFINSDRP